MLAEEGENCALTEDENYPVNICADGLSCQNKVCQKD